MEAGIKAVLIARDIHFFSTLKWRSSGIQKQVQLILLLHSGTLMLVHQVILEFASWLMVSLNFPCRLL